MAKPGGFGSEWWWWFGREKVVGVVLFLEALTEVKMDSGQRFVGLGLDGLRFIFGWAVWIKLRVGFGLS